MADYFIPLWLGGARGVAASMPKWDWSRGDGDALILFDADTEKKIFFKFHLAIKAGETVSTVNLVGNISMDGANTSDGVVLGCRIQTVAPDANDKFASGGWATQVKDRVVVDDDADEIVSFDLDMSSNDDGMAPNDTVWLEFSRVGDDTTTETDGDDATGDMQLESLALQIVTT